MGLNCRKYTVDKLSDLLQIRMKIRYFSYAAS